MYSSKNLPPEEELESDLLFLNQLSVVKTLKVPWTKPKSVRRKDGSICLTIMMDLSNKQLNTFDID